MADASMQRVAFSPGEFAELFGKSQTWGYRQIYAGKVTAITEHGRILIPAKEVERILESAGVYDGKQKPKKSKADFKRLTTQELGVWQQFVASRRGAGSEKESSPKLDASVRQAGNSARSSVLERVANSWRGNVVKR